MNVPVIAASKWNHLVADIERGTPLEGIGCKVMRTAEGAMVSARGSEDWNHPWKLSARWQPADKVVDGMPLGEWHVSVQPGFVNGRDATITMQAWNGTAQRADVRLTDEPAPHLVIRDWRNHWPKPSLLEAFVTNEHLTLHVFQCLWSAGHVGLVAGAVGAERPDGLFHPQPHGSWC